MVAWRYRAAALGLAASILAGHAGAAPACNMRLVAELPARISGGAILAAVSINGHQTEAEIDSGVSESKISAWALPQLGLMQHPVDATVVSPSGNRTAYATSVDKLQMGKLTVKDVPLLVNGMMGERHDVDEAPIVIGARLLSDFDVEFDLANKAVRLFKPEGCHGDEVLYWGGAFSMAPLIGNPDAEYYFRIPVTLNGQTVQAMIGSGSGYSWVASSVAQNVGARDVAGAQTVNSVNLITRPKVFNTVTIDQEAMKNVTLEVADLKQKFARDALGTRLGAFYRIDQMLLGNDFLRAHRLIISNSQHGVYFTYAGGPIFSLHTASGGEGVNFTP
jgi:predicted aspartyl protease